MADAVFVIKSDTLPMMWIILSKSMNDTISLGIACADMWDIVVVGSGVSGSITAREAALLGSRVLLIDKARLPRRKVCGCYLNANTLACLQKLNLAHLVIAAEAPTVKGVYLSAGKYRTYIPLPTGAALSRFRMDEQLSAEAIAAGVSFLSGTEAHLVASMEDHIRLRVNYGSEIGEIRSRIVVAADGLAGGLARETNSCTRSFHPNSRIGVSAAMSHAPRTFTSGTIEMVIGRDGYIGILQVEDGHLEIAGALDPAVIKRWGLAETIQRIFRASPLPELEAVDELLWKGTTPLSANTTPVASHRLFFVGDAAGYVEPYTGEGMTWAIASAATLAPIAHEAAKNYSCDLQVRWIKARRRLLGSHMRVCRLLTQGLRNALLAEFTVRILKKFPFLATGFANWLYRPWPIPSASR